MASEMSETKERLAEALKEEGASPELVRQARRGEYDDYESTVAFPQMTLVAAIKRDRRMASPAKGRFIARVQDGEFDATREESGAWLASPEGQAAMRDLTEGVA
jgi:hypothetical protein